MKAGIRTTLLALPLLAIPALLAAQGNVVVRRFVGDDVEKWTFSLAAGRPLGGPPQQMEARLLEEGWTEHYCDVWKSNCHDNPLIGAPPLSFTTTIKRRLTDALLAGAMVSYSNLGSAEGRNSGTDVKADWSALMLGTSLSFRPTRILRVTAGPLLSFLQSQTTGDTPRTVLRPGALFEAAVRNSATRAMFFEVSASYRLLGKRLEGPWPGYRRGFSAPAGPTPLEVNFSHFSLSFGVGWRIGS